MQRKWREARPWDLRDAGQDWIRPSQQYQFGCMHSRMRASMIYYPSEHGWNSVPDLSDRMSFGPTVTLVSGVARTTRAALALYPVVRISGSIVFSVAVAVFYRAVRENTYNMLWAVLFGFATLNILGLAARRMEPRRGLSFGEVMAVLTVFLAVFLLGWEMLGIFHIFPIKLR